MRLILFWLLPGIIFAQIEIKSLQIYKNDRQAEYPVILSNEEVEDYLTIEFDIKSEFEPDLKLKFFFCDDDWEIMESPFFITEGENEEPYLDFEELPNTVIKADYHYLGTFPNGNVSFNFSGKYIFQIIDKDNDEILKEGRFFYIKEKVDFSEYSKFDSFSLSSMNNRNKTLRIVVEGELPEEMFPHYLSKIEIIKNQEVNFPFVVTVKDNSEEKYFETDGSLKYKFVQRNIFPGNEYRIIDLRNTKKYLPEILNTRFGEIDIPRNYDQGFPDHNGGMILMNYEKLNANYLDFLFKLDAEERYKNHLFIIGSFNDWTPEQMEFSNGYYSIKKELKRGVYDYQYVVIDSDGKIDFTELEGNFIETKNIYHTFLYSWNDEYGGYMEIIGYKKYIR